MTLKQIIENTNYILPFETENNHNSFTVIGNYENNTAYTFKYENEESLYRNIISFCNAYKKLLNKDIKWNYK
jgi:hypothetical protein